MFLGNVLQVQVVANKPSGSFVAVVEQFCCCLQAVDLTVVIQNLIRPHLCYYIVIVMLLTLTPFPLAPSDTKAVF